MIGPSRHHLPFYESLESGPLAIAHRGGNAANTHDDHGAQIEDKQNSIVAFESAWQIGIRYGETDTIRTAGGVLLAFHGSKNEKQKVETGLPTRQEIQALDFDEVQTKVRIGGEPIPSLEELLTTFPEMRFFIDPKTNEAVAPLARLIGKLRVHDRVSVGAFSYKRTQGVIDLMETQKRVAITVGPVGSLALLGSATRVPGTRAYLRRTHIVGFSLPHKAVTPKMVEIAHDLGKPVSVWTPNDAESIERSFDNGVDGVMSDMTRLVYEAVQSRRKSY